MLMPKMYAAALALPVPRADSGRHKCLTMGEIERVIEAAKGSLSGDRDATMILTAYRHGLRASEVVTLRWKQINFASATMKVHRMHRGTTSVQRISRDELRALRRLKDEQSPKSAFVFISNRHARFSQAGFSRILARAGYRAALPFKAHPHMLRHARGLALLDQGKSEENTQRFLGLKNRQGVKRYGS